MARSDPLILADVSDPAKREAKKTAGGWPKGK